MLIALLLLSCSPGKVAGADDPTEGTDDPGVTAYDLDHLLRVELELPADDWDQLRTQTRTLADTLLKEDCQSEPFESPFTWFEASATIDGQHFERVDLRKKGFLGSMSEEKPALKLDLGEYEDDATFQGERRLTLNNAVSDPAYVRQCVSYGFFDDAGLPAPRCSLAQVMVNGEDLGIFVNVEPIKEPMLARLFDDGEGNLYEGTLSDFREGWTGTLEKKNNEGADDWSDIEALVDAAAADDDDLLGALDAVLDLDAFLGHWAAEVIVQHTDGYAWNTNNFYLYADPADGRLHFIPWGTDAVLYGSEQDQGASASVYAFGLLADRLYSHPEGRARYLDRLSGLLDEHWDEGRAADRMQRMASLIEPELSGAEWSLVEDQIRWVEDIVDGQREAIEGELSAGGADWPYDPRDSYCFTTTGDLDATFSTTWGSLLTDDPFNTGSSDLYIELEEGKPWPLLEGSALAGSVEGDSAIYLPAWISSTEAILIYVALDESQVDVGEVELDLATSYGGLLYLDTETMEDFEFVAYVMGTLRFDRAGTTEGDAVEGTLEGGFLWL